MHADTNPTNPAMRTAERRAALDQEADATIQAGRNRCGAYTLTELAWFRSPIAEGK